MRIDWKWSLLYGGFVVSRVLLSRDELITKKWLIKNDVKLTTSKNIKDEISRRDQPITEVIVGDCRSI